MHCNDFFFHKTTGNSVLIKTTRKTLKNNLSVITREFSSTPPIATYLFALALGPFDSLHDSYDKNRVIFFKFFFFPPKYIFPLKISLHWSSLKKMALTIVCSVYIVENGLKLRSRN